MPPASALQSATLIEFGLIEMRDDTPVLAQAGDRVLD